MDLVLNRFQIGLINADLKDKVNTEEDAESATEISRCKSAAMVGAIGAEGVAIFDEYGVNVEYLKYKDVVDMFNRCVGGRENMAILRHLFLKSMQEERKGLELFMSRVHQLSPQCQFCDMSEYLKMNVVLNGMREEKLQTAPLQMSDLNINVGS